MTGPRVDVGVGVELDQHTQDQELGQDNKCLEQAPVEDVVQANKPRPDAQHSDNQLGESRKIRSEPGSGEINVVGTFVVVGRHQEDPEEPDDPGLEKLIGGQEVVEDCPGAVGGTPVAHHPDPEPPQVRRRFGATDIRKRRGRRREQGECVGAREG